MTDYKATPEQWANVQKFAAVATESCLLELRARVEALEANAKPTPNDRQIRSSNYPEKPDSSLVERVASAIAKAEHLCDAEDALPEARAAIREVAAWMREQQDGDLIAATMLEQEAGR